LPNWCDNRLVIMGPEADVKALKIVLADRAGSNDKSHKSDLFLMNMAEPWSSEREKEQYFSGKDDWYDLRITHWGTKWDIEATLDPEETTESCLTYHFCSAWSPPLPAVETCSSRWPNLTFVLEFDEAGNDFAGRFEYKAGAITNREEGPSRRFFCHLCESLTLCDWGSELQCGFTGAAELAEGEEFSSLLHAVSEGAPDSPGLVDSLRAWVALVEGGIEEMPPWRQEMLKEAFKDSGLHGLKGRKTLMKKLASPMPTWLAVALMSGLPKQDVEFALVDDDEEIRLIAHLGTVGGILDSPQGLPAVPKAK